MGLKKLGILARRRHAIFMRRTAAIINGLKRRLVKMKLPACSVTLEQFRLVVTAMMGSHCRYCGQLLIERNFSLDHPTPLERGGSSAGSDNLRLICAPCNRAKGNFTDEEFHALIGALDVLAHDYPESHIKQSVLTALKVSNSFRFGANRRSKKVG